MRNDRPQRVTRLVVHPMHQARRVVSPQVPLMGACRLRKGQDQDWSNPMRIRRTVCDELLLLRFYSLASGAVPCRCKPVHPAGQRSISQDT